jgi:metal-responsive CopG/Arc/MetJ family transcriptional regulator
MSVDRICISLDSELLKKVVAISNKEDRSISKQISNLIRKGMEKKE